MVSGLTGSSYSEHLIELNFQSLESRRLCYDIIETYKIIHGVTNVNKSVRGFQCSHIHPIELHRCLIILFYLVPIFVELIFVNIFFVKELVLYGMLYPVI